MKKFLGIIMAIGLTSCVHVTKHRGEDISIKAAAGKASQNKVKKSIIRFSDKQLEAFLDSIGQLPIQPLVDKVSFGIDSVFKNQLQLDTTISLNDFNKLKLAARKGVIAVSAARRIFGNNKIDSACNEKNVLLTYKPGLIPIVYYSFDKGKNSFNEYALCVGDPEHCVNAYLYFFKDRKIIARHKGYNRNGLDLGYIKDENGKTVIHYKVEFDRGSGIWWYQFFFYEYDGNKLIPVLNIPQNINLLQPSPWGVRELWLESFVQKTNHLVIKMVYHQQLPDTVEYDHFTTDPNLGPKIVDDSTFVRYSWDKQTKSLQGNFKRSKISKPQILSYYLVDNELLFINAYNKNLKLLLLDKTKRKSTLHYINEIKNFSSGK